MSCRIETLFYNAIRGPRVYVQPNITVTSHNGQKGPDVCVYSKDNFSTPEARFSNAGKPSPANVCGMSQLYSVQPCSPLYHPVRLSALYLSCHAVNCLIVIVL